MNLTLVWYACVSLHICCISLTPSIHSPPALSLQRPAPLDWRIWVIWTTKGLLDTGAPSVNTTQLDAQMMTPKVFCGLTSGWNLCVNIAWCRNICRPVHVWTSPMPLLKLHVVIHSYVSLTLSREIGAIQTSWHHAKTAAVWSPRDHRRNSFCWPGLALHTSGGGPEKNEQLWGTRCCHCG